MIERAIQDDEGRRQGILRCYRRWLLLTDDEKVELEITSLRARYEAMERRYEAMERRNRRRPRNA